MNFTSIVFSTMSVIAVMLVWFQYCNNKTHKQRKKLIDFCFDNMTHTLDEIDELSKEFRHISYETHFAYLLFFRDPRKLYSEELRKALDN